MAAIKGKGGRKVAKKAAKKAAKKTLNKEAEKAAKKAPKKAAKRASPRAKPSGSRILRTLKQGESLAFASSPELAFAAFGSMEGTFGINLPVSVAGKVGDKAKAKKKAKEKITGRPIAKKKKLGSKTKIYKAVKTARSIPAPVPSAISRVGAKKATAKKASVSGGGWDETGSTGPEVKDK